MTKKNQSGFEFQEIVLKKRALKINFFLNVIVAHFSSIKGKLLLIDVGLQECRLNYLSYVQSFLYLYSQKSIKEQISLSINHYYSVLKLNCSGLKFLIYYTGMKFKMGKVNLGNKTFFFSH